jgi:hypothetical protein
LLEKRSLSSTCYRLHRGWSRDLALGWAIGALTLALSVGIAYAAGAMRFAGRNTGIVQAVLNFLILFSILLIAAAFEEVLVRGFAFQAMLHNGGPALAIAVTSGLFALLHLSNPNITALSTINTALAGVWLGAAYIKTRSLWLATALHHSWNLAMVVVFGLPVSGLNMYESMAWLDGEGLSPVWLSGGEYGPEGGLAATLAMILSTIVIAKSRLFKTSDEMIAALRHGSITPQPARIFNEESDRPSQG